MKKLTRKMTYAPSLQAGKESRRPTRGWDKGTRMEQGGDKLGTSPLLLGKRGSSSPSAREAGREKRLRSWPRLTALLAAWVLLTLLPWPKAALAEEEGPLSGVTFISAAQVQDELYLLGTSLYAYDEASAHFAQVDAFSLATCAPEAQAEDLLAVSGGDELHVLDTRQGLLYRAGEGSGEPIARFSKDAFDGETDPLEKRNYRMPTLVQTGDEETLYLLISNPERPVEYELYFFGLQSGKSGKVRAERIAYILDYKDGKLAALVDETDKYRIVTIDTATNTVSDLLYEENNLRYTLLGMAYDRAQDRLVVITGDGIYRIEQQEMIDLCTYLPDFEQQGRWDAFFCFHGGKLTLVNQSAFYTKELLSEEGSRRLHFANGGRNAIVMGFMQENPDVKVSFESEMEWDIKRIYESLLTQNSGIDIITLYAGAGLTAMKNKGYYVDLSGSELLMDEVKGMYPAIRDVLMDGEHLVAYPEDAGAYCWLVDEDALREKGFTMEGASMSDWLDFVEAEAASFDPEESAHAIFPSGFTRKDLLYELLKQYILEAEPTGQLDFQAPALKDCLARVLRLPNTVFWKNQEDDGSANTYDTGLPPLFDVYAELSPYSYVGFYEDYHPTYVLPPAFNDTSAMRLCMSVYLVNPYSENKDTAMAFIEYWAQQADPLWRFYLEEEHAQAIPSPEYQEMEARTLREMEALEAELAQAAPEDRRRVEDILGEKSMMLEYARANAWMISQEEAAAYQRMVPSMTLLADSLCFRDSSCSASKLDLYQQIEQLLAGRIDLERLLATAQQKYGMMRIEAE